MFPLKKNITYALCVFCLVGILFNSFHATFRLLKQTTTIVINEIDSEDLEEDETEKKELNEDGKIIAHFDLLVFINTLQNTSVINPTESKLVSMIKNVQGPPPKI